MARRVGAPAQVDVVAHQRQPPVEAAQLLVDVAADEHPGAGDGEDRADLVVLALVLLAAVQAGPAAAAAGDGDAHLQQLPAVVPAAQLGADDGGRGAGVGDAQQFGEGGRFGRAVVVQQPQPLDRFTVREFRHVVRVVAPGAADGVPAAGPPQVRQVVGGEHRGGADRFVDGGAEAGAAGEVQHPLVAEGGAEELGGVVRAAGVGADDVLHRAFLALQPGERVGQPAGTVVGDDHGGDDMPWELWGACGICGGLGRRLAVHGHRGTGPPDPGVRGRRRSRADRRPRKTLRRTTRGSVTAGRREPDGTLTTPPRDARAHSGAAARLGRSPTLMVHASAPTGSSRSGPPPASSALEAAGSL